VSGAAARLSRGVRLLRANPAAPAYVAREALWSALPGRPQLLPLTWPLDERRLAKLVVRWPTPLPLADAAWWEPKLRTLLAAHVPLQSAAVDHPFTSIVRFEAVLEGRTHTIAIDYRDTNEVPEECAGSADLYFKLQFAREGYPYEHVVPGGYVVGQQKFLRYLHRLRALRRRESRFEVYGRFGRRGEALRRHVTDLLSGQDAFAFTGGLSTVLYFQSLCEAARTKVAIDLPGHGWFSYRLVEYFGIGSCVVAVPHGNRLHVELEDRKHLAYTQPGGDDVVELAQHYLEHEDERRALMESSRTFFDRYLHHRQLGAYYLTTIFERLG
jgi:hypothetical protein